MPKSVKKLSEMALVADEEESCRIDSGRGMDTVSSSFCAYFCLFEGLHVSSPLSRRRLEEFEDAIPFQQLGKDVSDLEVTLVFTSAAWSNSAFIDTTG